MTIGIYKIEALCPVAKLAGRAIYIGQSKNIERRWRAHHKRFPPDQYEYMVILEVPPEHDLNLLEKLFIDIYDSHKNGLNKTIGGTNIRSRYPDEETRRKIGEARKGRPGPNKGKPMSEEQKRKLSEAHKGKAHSEEHRHNVSEAKKGKPHSKKHKPFSEEHKRKLSEARKKQPVRLPSEETKCKMSEAQKKRWQRQREQQQEEVLSNE